MSIVIYPKSDHCLYWMDSFTILNVLNFDSHTFKLFFIYIQISCYIEQFIIKLNSIDTFILLCIIVCGFFLIETIVYSKVSEWNKSLHDFVLIVSVVIDFTTNFIAFIYIGKHIC